MNKILFSSFNCNHWHSNTDAQLLKNAQKLISSGSNGLLNKDAADGIKEALVNGTGESVKLVSIVDGYWGNPEIKIPFPSRSQRDGVQTENNRYGQKGGRIQRFH